MVNGNLPVGWEWSTLDKYRKSKRESVNPAKFPEQKFELYSVPSFESGKPEIVFGKEVGSSKQVVHANEVLICKINPRINRSWVVGNHTDNPKIASTEWFVFEAAENLNPKYLCYFMQMDTFRDHLAANVSGVGGSLMRARSSALENYPFPLAPLPEQERIVSRIEELFSDLEAGVAALERVHAGLKRYKASVLKAGMNGTLFGNAKNIDELPEGWQSVQLADVLSEPLTNGKSTPNAEEGFPVLRLTALKDGRIDLQERKIGAWTKGQAKNYLVKQGDFFVSRGNGSLHLVGRGGLVEQEPDDVAYPDTLIRIRVSPTDCDIKYLRTIWNSNFVRNQIETTARTTAGIYKINQKDLEGFTFPLPPLEEQRRIVAEVERRLSVVGEVESAVEAGLARASRLRQAVLRSAFEGRL